MYDLNTGFAKKKQPIVLNEQQEEAVKLFKEFTSSANLSFNLSGFSGTGKTTTASFFLQHLRTLGKHFMVCSPTHKANKVIKNALNIGAEIKTIASLFGNRFNILSKKWEFCAVSEDYLPPNITLLVDECGMINDETFICMLETCKQRNIQLVFMGDEAQIPPINSKTISLSFTDCDVKYTLTKLMRQKPSNPLCEIYTSIRENLLANHRFVTSINEETGEGLEIVNSLGLFESVIEEMLSKEEFKKDSSFCKIAAYTNNRVYNYNRIARKALLEDDLIPFQLGEILTGYNQIATEAIVQNSQDYVISKHNGIVNHRINFLDASSKDKKGVYKEKRFELKSYEISIKEVEQTSSYSMKINIPLIDDEYNFNFFHNLYKIAMDFNTEKRSDVKKTLYKAMVNIFKNVQLSDSLFMYDGICQSLTKLKKENRELFIQDSFGYSKFDQIMSNGLGYILEKNIDYGYAVTAHKVQGSTYQNVLVDLIDINNPVTNKQINKEGQPFCLERNTLKYVALSRCKHKTIALQ